MQVHEVMCETWAQDSAWAKEGKRSPILDGIYTDAGKRLITYVNNNFGSSVWSAVIVGVREIETEIRTIIATEIAREIEDDMEAMLPPVDNEEIAVYKAAEHCANIARRVSESPSNPL
jgi:hypothetical protein